MNHNFVSCNEYRRIISHSVIERNNIAYTRVPRIISHDHRIMISHSVIERNDITNTPIPRVVSHDRQARMVFRRENETVLYRFSEEIVDVHKRFQSRIDSLASMHMCHVCN